MTLRISWDQTHMGLCYMIAMRSPDPSTKLGAVIIAPDNRVVASGYNGWPRGVKPFEMDDPRWERPEKYVWMAHAERNALDNALRAGTSVEGCTLYTCILPCADCARGIIQAGIKKVVYHARAQEHFARHAQLAQSWYQQLDSMKRMLQESGVELVGMSEPVPRFESWLCGASFDPHMADPNVVLNTPEDPYKRTRKATIGFCEATVVRPNNDHDDDGA